MTDAPSPTPYERIGGDTGVRRLVERFYALMDTLPEARSIRALHPPELDSSKEKLYKFLSGWLGGPPLFVQEYGHPRLRARHLPFPIAEQERDAWMLCMNRALDEQITDPLLLDSLRGALYKLADFMRNRDTESPR